LRPSGPIANCTAAPGCALGAPDFTAFKDRDETIASESTVRRYSFGVDKYCEWIVYTIGSNLDTPGVGNDAPAAAGHCVPVMSNGWPVQVLAAG